MKYPYDGESVGIDIPGFLHMMGFPIFYHPTEKLWENPCISHVMITEKFKYHGKSVLLITQILLIGRVLLRFAIL